jgi:hypothetical protein
LSKFLAPLSDGFVGDDHPPGQEQLFHIPIAQAEPEVQPHSMADNLGWEAVMLVSIGGVFMRRVWHIRRAVDKRLNIIDPKNWTTG